MSKKKILILFGGPSPEHDVSVMSAKTVLASLDNNKFDPDKAYIDRKGKWQFLPSKTKFDQKRALEEVKRNGYGLVFPVLHGEFGEDGHIQALLDTVGVRYAGSDMVASALAFDKNLANRVLKANGFNVPEHIVVKGWPDAVSVRFPVVVKPVDGGSSLGMSIVRKRSELNTAIRNSRRFTDRIMIQKLIEGREFTCGVLEKNSRPFSLIPTEIIPRRNFDYKAKYTKGGSIEITPPDLHEAKINELRELALKAHCILKLSGMSRSDFIFNGSEFYILEVNTIPGLTEFSLLPKGAKAMGISFAKMLELIIISAK